MLASIIRTLVPVIVGVLLGWAAKAGFDLPAGAVTEVVTVALTTGYYTVSRLLEQQWPQLGRILLSLGLTSAGSPVYARVSNGTAGRLPRA
jgi:hypothetical protein